MKAEYVNPFYQATINVFKLMLDIDVMRDTSKALQQMLGKQEVGVIIEVEGDLSGYILYRFPDTMILEMVKIMSGLEFDQVDSFVTSALAEVSNIISGNAVSSLFNQNYRCNIKPPRIVLEDSKPICLECPPGEPVLRLPLQTPIGKLEIDMALKETSQRVQ
ncbi:MAG TPA: chemotaxis protein CheX [Clostridia bacterium]|nr:chemotaxis protein CheX [Clostridia bacterium]